MTIGCTAKAPAFGWTAGLEVGVISAIVRLANLVRLVDAIVAWMIEIPHALHKNWKIEWVLQDSGCR
jgi:hypothetical protein